MNQRHAKILVIRGGAIGDFILTLPVFAALRRRFPGIQLEVLGYPHIAQLAQAGGLVDEVRSIEARALAGFFAEGGQLDDELADYFADFALILSYLYDPDGIFQANVARCSKAEFIGGPHRPDEKSDAPATEVLLKPLERLTIYDADPVPHLELVSSTDVGMGVGRWLAVHPGSGSERKNWPGERWGELLETLVASTELGLLLVGGEAEGDRLERFSARFPTHRLQFARNLPLSELAHRLKRCAAFIGHDSGISHLAAALGLPTLILWGDTNESVWRPRNERVSVLRHPGGLQRMTADVVLQRLRAVLGPLA